MFATILLCSVLLPNRLGPVPKNDFKVPPPLTAEFRMDPDPDSPTSYYLKVTYTYVDGGQGEDYYDCCINECRGHKHVNHEECSSSCDTICPEKEHFVEFGPEPDNYFEKSVGTQILEDVGRKFAPDNCAVQFAKHSLNVAEIPVLADPAYTVREVWPCWNNTPCSDSERGVGSRLITIQVSYSFSKEISGMRAQGPTGKFKYESFWVPNKDDKFEETYIECYCAYVEKMANFALRPNKIDLLGGIRLGDAPFAPIVPLSTLDKYGFKVSCEDMNSVEMSCGNPTGMPLTISMRPGTMLVSNDPESQNMLVTKNLSLTIPAWATASISVPLGDGVEPTADNPSVSGNAVCINMKLHPPTKAVQYRALNSPILDLKKLANFASKERIIGPWVQTRFWIVTDQATLADVRKILIPKPTEGIYLRALEEAARVCRIDMTKPAYKPCMDPSLLVGMSAPARATEWFVETMSKSDPSRLATWLNHNRGAFASLFEPDQKDFGPKHAADVANALCMSRDSSVQMAGFDFLRNSIPETDRADLVKANGLDGLTQVLVGGDDKAVSQALDVAEAYKSRAVIFGVMNLSAKASPETKARALALVKSLR